MKHTIITCMLAFIVSASAFAQSKDTVLTITLKLPASKLNAFLTANSVNVDTLSNISARQATLIKQDAQQVGQYLMGELTKAMQPVWDKERKGAKK